MADHRAPHNLEAEQAVLGAVLLGPSIIPALVTDHGLRSHHFYRPRHAAIFEAMVALSDAGTPPDPVLVADRLTVDDDGRAYIHSLPSMVPTAAHWPAYVATVLEDASLRRIEHGARKILEGVAAGDLDKIADGEAMLGQREQGERRTSSPEDLAQELFDELERDVPPETFRWPYPRFDKLTMGGMRRGQLTLVAGWTSMGKSVFLDQALESAAADGLRVHLFINEMTKRERTGRMVARLARVPIEHIELNRLADDERARIVRALDKIPFGITDCSGWSAQDVGREVRRGRYDLVGVDVFNRFPFRGRERREAIEEASRVLNELTKESQAHCHLLVAAHLNRNRAGQSQVLPFPTTADIRDSAMLANDADNVVFVHREQDEETGDPLPNGIIRFAKVRGGRRGGVPVRFVPDYVEFEPRMADAGSIAA